MTHTHFASANARLFSLSVRCCRMMCLCLEKVSAAVQAKAAELSVPEGVMSIRLLRLRPSFFTCV
ncbi:hypothetical protein FAI40_04875 [Acetobacteraceae bacterium]|nr:hypothetical protein FAI40_04875 [Acetobacteraceae bacterium]